MFYVSANTLQDSITNLRVGRVDIQRVQPTVKSIYLLLCFYAFIFLWFLLIFLYTMQMKHKVHSFVEIRSSLHVLERIACSIKYNEPVLLVGETGTGKTTLVQSLARRIGHKFTVLVCSCFICLYFSICSLIQ